MAASFQRFTERPSARLYRIIYFFVYPGRLGGSGRISTQFYGACMFMRALDLCLLCFVGGFLRRLMA